MIEIIQQPDIFAFANTPILYKVKSDNLRTHYNSPYQYRYQIKNTGWSMGDTFTLNIYFNDNGKPLELVFRVGPLVGPDPSVPSYRPGYTISVFDSILMSTGQLCQDLLKNNTLNAYVDVERIIVGSRYFIVFTPKTDDIVKVEFVTTFLTDFDKAIAPISNIRDSYKIVAELISQRYEENLTSRYDTIHSSFAYLNAEGEAIFDFSSSVSEVLSNNLLDNFFQSLVSENAAQSWRGELKFGVHLYETWIDADGNDVIGDHLMSSYSSILQNGLQGADKLLGLNFFDNHDGYNLLSYQPRTKLVQKDDIDFLPFFLKNKNATVIIKISISYVGVGGFHIERISAPNTRLSSVFVVPSGYNQIRIDDIADPTEVIEYYIVQLESSPGVEISEKVTYLIDYKYYEKNNSFVFLNSLGVPEAINLKGVKTTTAEVERKILRTPQIDGQLSQFAHLLTPTHQLRSGNHLSAVFFKAIDELVASNHTYEVLNGLIVPIIINNKNTTEYTEKVNLLEFTLEYAPAIKGGAMLSEFYKKLSVKRSTCVPWISEFGGSILGLVSFDVGLSYDSQNHYLDDDADVEYIITLQRPNPLTIRIAGEFRQSFSSLEQVKLLEVGLSYNTDAPLYYYDLLGLIKNVNGYAALAFPIQVSMRVRQKSIGDEWSFPVIKTIPVLEFTSMYRPIQDMQKWGKYIFGVHRGCVFMVDERGRRTTIAGSLTEYGTNEGYGKDARFDGLFSIVVDPVEMHYDFPTIYIYDNTANRICKIYLYAAPLPDWYVEVVFTYPDSANRKLTIHPTLRYDVDKPVFIISESYSGTTRSLISTINMNTMTRTYLMNIAGSGNIADGDYTHSKCYKIVSVEMTSEKELVFLESGYTGKTAIVRIALCDITSFSVADKINEINNPTKWTVKTIAGAGSVVNSYADINAEKASGEIILGSAANSMRLYRNVNKIIKVGEAYYIAAGISNVVLKMTKQEGISGYEPHYYKVELVTGKSDEPGFFYDIPAMTLLTQPLSITADADYLYVSQNANGQILKISLKDYTTSVFSGEGTYISCRDWGLR